MSTNSPPGTHGRKYRSKKQRPCDLCRTRKTQCKIQERDAPCEPCRKLRRQCTFVLEPLKRKYRVYGDESADVNNPSDSNRETDVQLAHNSNANMLAEASSFWLAADSDRGPRADLDLMNWSSLDFSPDPIHHQSQLDNGLGFSSHLGARSENILPQASRETEPIILSDESPSSISEGDGHINEHLSGRDHDSIMSDGLGVFHQQSPGIGPQHAAPDWSKRFSLDRKEGHSSQLIGLSSESDPYLLRHYIYDKHDTYPMYRLHFRKVASGRDETYNSTTALGHSIGPQGHIPVQFVLVDEEIWKDDIKAAESLFSEKHTETQDTELFHKLITRDLELALIKLYTQFVHPRYPVLCLSDLSRTTASDRFPLSIGLRSAVCALAAPFTIFDDELSVSKGYLEVPAGELWAISHRSFQRASRSSHLSLLQLCLLILQQPPQSFVVAEPPSFWALSCSALAIAENLGLNLDPLDWRLPRQEVRLRRRLWWLTYSVHIWQAIGCGRPSHINDANWDVSNIGLEDLDTDDHEDVEIRKLIEKQKPIFLAEIELSVIAADVLKEFYTIKGNRGPLVLSDILSRAQPLRTRIESWRQSMSLLSTPVSELTDEDFERSANLRLSHLTLEILIFRAILRPLFGQAVAAAENAGEPVSMIFENCYTCAKVATEVISSLHAKHFAKFWPPHVRYHLCSISTFILLNLAHSTTKDMAIRNKALLSSWRDTLRLQARAWPLARLAAMRLSAVCWKGLSSVVHGVGLDSPAAVVCSENVPKSLGGG